MRRKKVCVWVCVRRRRRKRRVGQNCPTRGRESRSSGRERRECRRMGRRERGGRPIGTEKGGNERGREAEERRKKNRSSPATRFDPRHPHPNSDDFHRNSHKLDQGTTSNQHLGLPSSCFPPKIMKFDGELVKNAPVGAATFLFKFFKS